MAGTIDQLNFEAILHDEALNKKIKDDLKLMQKFNVSASKLLEVQSKLRTKQVVSTKGVDNAREMSRILDEIITKVSSLPGTVKIVEDSTKETAEAEKQPGDEVKKTNASLSGTTNLMRTLARLTGVTFGVAGFRRFVSSLVEVTGNLEMQREAMNHILGSAEKGGIIFEQLKELAKPSYFTLPDLTKYAKQLSALSIPYNELFETTKMLGDVSAGLGVSFDRIALAYGHIRSMGFLRGMQARQLTNAGIPIFEELAKNLSQVEGKLVSISEVYDRMSKRQITFEQVKEVFTQMTSEGGKFYNMQIALTDTLAGRVNKLKGVWQIALSDLGKANSGVLKGTVNAMIALAGDLEQIGNILKPVIAAFGTYYAALLLVASIQKVVGIGKLAIEFFNVAKSAGLAAAATATFGSVWKGLARAIGVLSLIGVAIYEWVIKPMKEAKASAEAARHTIEGYMTALGTEKKALKSLTDQLEKATAGTQEYNDAKDEIIRKYDKYLSDVDRENLAIGKTAGLYDALAVSIEKASRATFLANMDDWTQEQYKKAQIDLSKSLDRFHLSDTDRQIALGYILGEIPKENLSDAVKALFNVPAFDQTTGQLAGYINYLDQFKTAYEDATERIIENNRKVREAMRVDDGGLIGPERLLDFQQIVFDRLKKVPDAELRDRLGRLYGFGDEKDWDSYADKISKAYDELNKQLGRAFSEERKKPILEEIGFLKQLNADFGGALLSGNKTTKKEDSTADGKRKQKIAGLRAEISVIEKYQKAVDRIKAFTDDEATIKTVLHAAFDIDFEDIDFIAQIEDKLKELEGLGPDAKQAADSIRASLGIDAVSKWEKEQKSLQKGYDKAAKTAQSYRELIRSWSAEDTTIEGKGFLYDISKVASDLETKLNKLAVQGEKAKEKLAGIDPANEGQKSAILKSLTEGGMTQEEAAAWWDAWIVGGEAAIDRLIAAGRRKATATAQESLNDLAGKYVKEKTSGMELRDWGGKSISQTYRLWKELDRFTKDNALVDDATKKRISDLGLTIEDFAKLTRQDFQQLSDNAKEELGKKLVNSLKFAVGEIGKVVSALGDLAEATGDEGLASAVEFTQGIGDMANSVMQGFQQGGWVGAAIAGVASIATSLIEAETKAAKLRQAIAEAREEMRMYKFEQSLSEGVSSIFGDNDWRGIRNAVRELDNARKAIEEFNDKIFEEFREAEEYASGVGLSLSLEDIADHNLRTYHPGGLASLWRSDEYKSLAQLAKEIDAELYDEYGNLNAHTLQVILDTYGDLRDDDREWLTDAIHNSEMYAKTMEQIKEAMQDVFGEIASSASDSIVDAWKARGEAALDYSDILDDVATRYAKMLVESAILDQVLNEEEVDRVMKMFSSGDREGAMAAIADDMEQIAAMEPVFADILQSFEPYFNRSDTDSSGSLSSGIKSITEDQAGLLASYINGMRGDLSVVRGLQASGWQDVKAIREALQTQVAPNYNEYMAQIAANTYDTAQNTHDLLRHLRSVIGTGNSGSAIRTMK